MRRAATLGDGWHGVRMRPADLAEASRTLNQMRKDGKVVKKPFDISLRSTLDVLDSPLAEIRTPMTGSAAQIIDDIRSYETAGLHHMVLGPRSRGLEETASMAERFAERVLPMVR